MNAEKLQARFKRTKHEQTEYLLPGYPSNQFYLLSALVLLIGLIRCAG